MSKFGPSGSLKDTNIVLEDTRAVMAKIIDVVFFDCKFISVIILENLRAAGLGFEPRYSPPKGDVLPLDDPAIG